jgi:hypothetical protein
MAPDSIPESRILSIGRCSPHPAAFSTSVFFRSTTGLLWFFQQGGTNALLERDGGAIVVHAQPDDYRADPAGDAGDRIACGVIEKT